MEQNLIIDFSIPFYGQDDRHKKAYKEMYRLFCNTRGKENDLLKNYTEQNYIYIYRTFFY
jgi:hypothetical protein